MDKRPQKSNYENINIQQLIYFLLLRCFIVPSADNISNIGNTMFWSFFMFVLIIWYICHNLSQIHWNQEDESAPRCCLFCILKNICLSSMYFNYSCQPPPKLLTITTFKTQLKTYHFHKHTHRFLLCIFPLL